MPDREARPEELLAEALVVLHGNGAGTARTEGRSRQLGAALGLTDVALDLGWTRSTVSATRSGGGPVSEAFTGPPTAVTMNRVLAVDEAIERLAGGRSDAKAFRAEVQAATALPPSGTGLFAAACAVGAVGLALVLGSDSIAELLVVAVAAGAGGVLRRGMARLGGSPLWQAAAAALLAGLCGGLALRLGVSDSLMLAALCPCMVLVPGPHLLNAALDLAALRLPLGGARLAFAVLTLGAIGAGLLVGLTLVGAELDVDPAGRDVALWVDAPVAGVVAVCYGVFYSAPLAILWWPLVVGAAVHALHWTAVGPWHLDGAVAAGLAALVAATVLRPVSWRFGLPFSAIGFASVVSMLPGALVLRAFAALAQLDSAGPVDSAGLLTTATVDGTEAVLTVAALAVGFIVPTAVYALAGADPAARPRG
jgi:uncharacterized membrane protein YjjP (DUF1212 family)